MQERIRSILERGINGKWDLVSLLEATDPEDIEAIRQKAEAVLLENCGPRVYPRGLLEFSNVCLCDCHYCGIRRGNSSVRRYTLSREEILAAADLSVERGYCSMVLQSGERRDEGFIALVEEAVRAVKERTRSEALPQGLGLTLCIGEQTAETYERLFQAGAHRYLLRIETSSPHLYKAFHPVRQRYEERVECLGSLRRAGYQVGTGVMIGLPGQTVADLADDLMFFREMDLDMIGMGPYVAHPQTPLARRFAREIAGSRGRAVNLALLMIAAARIFLKDVNIVASTALGTLDEEARYRGLTFGANVLMPPVTPAEAARDYMLYQGKPLSGAGQPGGDEPWRNRVRSLGREVATDTWGDPIHYHRRTGKTPAPAGTDWTAIFRGGRKSGDSHPQADENDGRESAPDPTRR